MTKQEWLKNYLVGCNFNIPAESDLQERLRGLTAVQIVQAMEDAKKHLDNLNKTSLGRELN
jgi:hypothetical protein